MHHKTCVKHYNITEHVYIEYYDTIMCLYIATVKMQQYI